MRYARSSRAGIGLPRTPRVQEPRLAVTKGSSLLPVGLLW